MPDHESRRAPRHSSAVVLGAIAAGGMLGAAARYAVGLTAPPPATGVPWATLGVNLTGCLLMGALMALVVEVRRTHALVRPFLGVGDDRAVVRCT